MTGWSLLIIDWKRSQMATPRAWDRSFTSCWLWVIHTQYVFVYGAGDCVCVCCLHFPPVSDERSRMPSVPILIFLFKCLIEAVGVYIIEVSSLRHSFSLPCFFFSFFYQTLKGKTPLHLFLPFLLLISLHKTSVNGEACGYAGLMECW